MFLGVGLKNLHEFVYPFLCHTFPLPKIIILPHKLKCDNCIELSHHVCSIVVTDRWKFFKIFWYLTSKPGSVHSRVGGKGLQVWEEGRVGGKGHQVWEEGSPDRVLDLIPHILLISFHYPLSPIGAQYWKSWKQRGWEGTERNVCPHLVLVATSSTSLLFFVSIVWGQPIVKL